MKLYLIGVHHFDPLGREQLKSILEKLDAENNGPPGLLALEWDKELFAELIATQRPRLRELAQSEWQNVTHEVIKILECTIGYDAETALELFPTSCVLWLNQGEPGSVAGLADHWFHIYKEILADIPQQPDWNTELTRLRVELWRQAEGYIRKYDRDTNWATLLLTKVSKAIGSWGVVIVGASHLGEDQRRLRKLLEARGQNCEVIFCRGSF